MRAPTVTPKLQQIAAQAARDPARVLTTLAPLMDRDFLREAYRQTSKASAPEIDGVTAQQYADPLDENLGDLYERVALAYFGVVSSLLGCIAFLGPGFSDGFRLAQVGRPLLAKGDFIGDDQPLGHFRLLGLLGEGEQPVDLRAQVAVEFEQTFVTDRTALGGISVDFGAVQADVSQGQHPNFLGVQEDMHKRGLAVLAERFCGSWPWCHDQDGGRPQASGKASTRRSPVQSCGH